MMNKKGAVGIQSFVNQGFIYALIFLIAFIIFIPNGGYKAIANIAVIAGQIPVWGWLIVGGILLIRVIRD